VSRGDLSLTWRTGFAMRTQRMQLQPDGRLQVETHTHFTDASRRKDFTATEYFRRQ
jgi:hypothetical protein